MASDDAKRLWLSRHRGEPTLELLEIDHPDLAGGPLRIAANTPGDDITHGGDVYTAAPVGLRWITDKGEAARMQLIAVNIDGAIGRGVDSIEEPATVTVKAVLPSAPNVVERGPITDLELRNVKWDSMAMTGDLAFPTVSDEAWPFLRVVQAFFPALFR